jgi:hypothetical protein
MIHLSLVCCSHASWSRCVFEGPLIPTPDLRAETCQAALPQYRARLSRARCVSPAFRQHASTNFTRPVVTPVPSTSASSDRRVRRSTMSCCRKLPEKSSFAGLLPFIRVWFIFGARGVARRRQPTGRVHQIRAGDHIPRRHRNRPACRPDQAVVSVAWSARGPIPCTKSEPEPFKRQSDSRRPIRTRPRRLRDCCGTSIARRCGTRRLSPGYPP